MKSLIYGLCFLAFACSGIPARADVYAPSDKEIREAQKKIDFTLSDSDLCTGIATQDYQIDGKNIKKNFVEKLLFPGGRSEDDGGEPYYRQLGNNEHYLAKYTHLVNCHIVKIKEEPNYIFILNDQVQLIKPQRYLNLIETFENMGVTGLIKQNYTYSEKAHDKAEDVLARLDKDEDEPCVDDWRYCLAHRDVVIAHPEAIKACREQAQKSNSVAVRVNKNHEWFAAPNGDFDKNTGIVSFFDKVLSLKCLYSLETRKVLKIY